MLSPLQIERLLKHCESIHKDNEDNLSKLAGNEYFEYVRNQGWCEALRLVLEKNGPGMIRNIKLEDDKIGNNK